MTPRFQLTCSHSASSYGRPVLLDQETGIAYGPMDLLECGPLRLPAAMLVDAVAEFGIFDPELVRRFVEVMP